MSEIVCKRCGASDYVKNGKVRGLQRYRCKGCGCNFTATKARGKSAAVKALATLLYAMGNMSFNGIARLLGVSDVAVLKWIRKEAEALPAPEMPADVEIVMLDEMHHFLKKRAGNYGFGERMILSSGELFPGFWVGVMMQPVGNFSPKSASKVTPSRPTT
jgi:transposase-like protein